MLSLFKQEHLPPEGTEWAGKSKKSMATASKYHATQAQMLTEQDYVEAAKADPSKFEVLYNKYYEQIFRFVYQRLDDQDTAYDITAQVFLKAMTNLKRYEFRGVPFSSWLYRIAQAELAQCFRKNKGQRTINVESTDIYQIIDEIEHDRLAEYHDQLVACLAELPEEDLQLVEMRYFEKRPFKEIAEILDITENNAKVKLYRLLDKLKKAIAGR